MPDEFEFVQNYRITKYAIILILSNKVIQIIFKDKEEIHIINNKPKKIIYIDK